MRQVIVSGISENRTPQAIALDLVGRKSKITGLREGGLIGLTPAQAQTTLRIRNALITGDREGLADYLGMKLRDKRYSTVVADVRRSGWDAALEAYNKNRSVKVTKAQLIATLIADHKSRALRFRADLIAENETLTALRAGRHEGYKQLLDSGTVSEDQIERSWDATGDKKTRPDHMAMEGQQVTGLSVPFVAPDGSRMMFPGDTSMGAPAKQTIRCRCFERIRIRYIR
ncbi:hypothetical protein A6R70_14430 [Agrobacterium rubi]|uniref:phage minor head protein n=1 Tax=Agrobacterium rubi TaxID=28099 RepID=UPI00201B7996|nr:hypothetical protein [Agrobacterium rubi]